MLKKFGTGIIDFQIPDSAFHSIDFGFRSFPSVFDCAGAKSRKSEVYLSSMVTVDSFRMKLLEDFLEYYIKLGIRIENFLLTVQMTSNSELEKVVFVLDAITKKGAYFDILIGKWTSESLMFHQAHKLLHCTTRKDWIIVADSDEFHEYPSKDVKLFLEKLDSQNINVVNGIFLDRVSRNGELVELQSEVHLFKQFELGCRFHRNFNLGTPKKVMAFKGTLRINRGHHRLALCWFWDRRNYLDLTPWKSCPPNNATKIKPYGKILNVHHFKWMKGQYEATLHKAEVWNETLVGESYKNVLRHFDQCKDICIESSELKCAIQTSLSK